MNLALDQKDAEALDDVTIGGWGAGLGAVLSDAVKDLRQRYMDHQQVRLLDGRVSVLKMYHAQD